VELDWLKKNLALTLEKKRGYVESDHPHLSIRRQCDLLDLNRSSFYSPPTVGTESSEKLEIMELIYKQYTDIPTYGSRRMTAWLQGGEAQSGLEHGYHVL
ncbi:hypothetical protein L2W31_12930, partial [Dethiosulfovibrio acidaminovorans]|nr:hypothetical protein [Dethiosulfovibrio acidaminovorans]